MVGLEPTLSEEKQILSLSCLPIPPHRHILPFMNNICNNKKTSNQVNFFKHINILKKVS